MVKLPDEFEARWGQGQFILFVVDSKRVGNSAQEKPAADALEVSQEDFQAVDRIYWSMIVAIRLKELRFVMAPRDAGPDPLERLATFMVHASILCVWAGLAMGIGKWLLLLARSIRPTLDPAVSALRSYVCALRAQPSLRKPSSQRPPAIPPSLNTTPRSISPTSFLFSKLYQLTKQPAQQ